MNSVMKGNPPLNWCYPMQYPLQLVSKIFRKKSMASCRRHVTRRNLELQLACNDSKNVFAIVAKSRTELCFLQSLQAKKVARQVAKRACWTLQRTCNLSRNPTATQLSCN